MSDGETLETLTATTEAGVELIGSTTTTAEPVAGATDMIAAPAQVVYVGPKLRSPYPVYPRTVFRGDLPGPLATAVAADADLAACFVPVRDLGAALASLKRAGSALSRSTAAVTANYLKKKEA